MAKHPDWEKPELEKDIEKYFVKEMLKLGYVAEKFSTPYKRSAPDQIVFVPNTGLCFFVEVKKEGGKATPKQSADHAKRREMGYFVFVLAGRAEVDNFLAFIKENPIFGAKV